MHTPTSQSPPPSGPRRSPPYFVYGTLLDHDVRIAVLGRVAHALQSDDAVLPGFERVCVPGRCYPMLREAPDGRVAGLVLRNLRPSDERRLVRFEGHAYVLATRTVQIAGSGPVPARLFLPRTPPAPAAVWSLDRWQRLHKRRFLRRIRSN